MRGRADEPGGKAMTAVAVGGPVARRLGLPRFLTSEHPLPWLLPSTAMMVVFGVYPLLYAIWLSLHKRNPVTRLSPFNPTWNWAKLFSDERVWLFLATDLSDSPGGAGADEDERIEIVPWRLDRLRDAIAECDDAKSLVALLWLAARR